MNPNPDRYNRIADVMKNITNLGKSIKKPTTLQFVRPGQGPAGLPEAVAGSFTVRVLLYIVAAILLVGLILLAIDQWVTPVFEKTPGDGGFIPVPGIDKSQAFWPNTSNTSDILIGTPPPPPSRPAPGSVAAKQLSSTLLEGQSNYSITMDILINDEFPQTLGNDANGNAIDKRTFFSLGPNVLQPSLSVSLDKATNTLYITAYNGDRQQQTITIDNVPIHTPFRIGISKSTNLMEGYLNGLLVQTLPLKTSTILPGSGDTIFSTASMINNGNVLSTGIKVRYLRLFGYTVPASEMKGRMGDVSDKSVYEALA